MRVTRGAEHLALAAVGAVNDVILGDRPLEAWPARRRRHDVLGSKNGQARRGTAEHDGSLEVRHLGPGHAISGHARVGLLGLAAQQHVNSRILAAKFGHLARAFRYLWWSFGAFVPACFVLWCIGNDDEPRLRLAPPPLPSVAPIFMWLVGRTSA